MSGDKWSICPHNDASIELRLPKQALQLKRKETLQQVFSSYCFFLQRAALNPKHTLIRIFLAKDTMVEYVKYMPTCAHNLKDVGISYF